MTHPINNPDYRHGFNIAFPESLSPVSWSPEPDPTIPTSSTYGILHCREIPIKPSRWNFGTWHVDHRGNHWIICVWQWPTPDACAAASDARHLRGDIGLLSHEWITPPADDTTATLMTLYEMSGIAREFTERYAKALPKSFFAYALAGPDLQDWTNAGSLHHHRVKVTTGDIIPPWHTMEDAWDAAIEHIKEQARIAW